MARTIGARNITTMDTRTNIASSPNAQIKHLASSSGETTLEYFHSILRHQSNYSTWIKSRHDELLKAKQKGPKDATFRKYKWYSEYLTLLESINAFEVFYKRTIVNLATALRIYVPADRVKGNIDTRILWSAPPGTPASDLIFESRLFHDLDSVDQSTESLVQSKRYNKNSPKPAIKSRVRCLQAIFQVRHTLSHNHGLITASDAGKLKLLGYNSAVGEVIDPTKDDLGDAIRKILKLESDDFTTWILSETADYLEKIQIETGAPLAQATLDIITNNIGTNPKLGALNWA